MVVKVDSSSYRSGQAGRGVPGPQGGTTSEPRLASGLEAGLQAVQRTGGAGGSGGFAEVDGEVDAAVDGVVVLVGGRGLTGVLPHLPSRIVVCVIDERDAGGGVVYPKLWVGHEVVYRCSGVLLFKAFVKGATECIHNSDLL